MNEFEKKKVSRFLSQILRHKPQKIDLELDNNGWAFVEELISKSANKNMIFSKIELEEIVSTNDKQRFIFSEDKSKIRANQGHSISIDLDLKPIQPPNILYHGTVQTIVNEILEIGILKMKRQHVHLSESIETAIKVGSRHGKPQVLIVNTLEMFNDDLLFYKSENGVWLTDFIDPKYIKL